MGDPEITGCQYSGGWGCLHSILCAIGMHTEGLFRTLESVDGAKRAPAVTANHPDASTSAAATHSGTRYLVDSGRCQGRGPRNIDSFLCDVVLCNLQSPTTGRQY